MPVVSHEVHPLFAEPYFRANIAGTITPAQIAFIQSLKMVNNMENLISDPYESSIKITGHIIRDFGPKKIIGMSFCWHYFFIGSVYEKNLFCRIHRLVYCVGVDFVCDSCRSFCSYPDLPLSTVVVAGNNIDSTKEDHRGS